MQNQEKIFRKIPLDDPEDLDVLLDIADLVRAAIDKTDFNAINTLIRYTVKYSYYEAFSWVLGILEETYGRGNGSLPDFECEIGRLIPDYREFVSRLQVDLRACGTDVVPIRDELGEVQAFFNVISYQTGFAHIDLVTMENFDAKDNDYILYKLELKNR